VVSNIVHVLCKGYLQSPLGYEFASKYGHRLRNKSFYRLRSIAIVGMSTDENKPAFVPKYLIEHGFNVIPVNPTATENLRRKSYPRIMDIPQHVDIVDVFRRSEDVLALVDDALKKRGLRVIWMQ
jgi:predicted CoA-binding protein